MQAFRKHTTSYIFKELKFCCPKEKFSKKWYIGRIGKENTNDQC